MCTINSITLGFWPPAVQQTLNLQIPLILLSDQRDF